ncbi:hypothetical protein QBC43DRAFT_353301, partial [Cladorrhinum sp. PSN259]
AVCGGRTDAGNEGGEISLVRLEGNPSHGIPVLLPSHRSMYAGLDEEHRRLLVLRKVTDEQTEASTLEERFRSILLQARFPPNIQRRYCDDQVLGVEYIRIDSLCIVKDDAEVDLLSVSVRPTTTNPYGPAAGSITLIGMLRHGTAEIDGSLSERGPSHRWDRIIAFEHQNNSSNDVGAIRGLSWVPDVPDPDQTNENTVAIPVGAKIVAFVISLRRLHTHNPPNPCPTF